MESSATTLSSALLGGLPLELRGIGAVLSPEVTPTFKTKSFLLSSLISTEHHGLCFTADRNECLCTVLSIAMKYIYVCIYIYVMGSIIIVLPKER